MTINKKHILISILSLSLVAGTASVALAEDSGVGAGVDIRVKRDEIKDIRAEVKANASSTRGINADLRVGLRSASSSDEREDIREEMKDNLERLREDRKEAWEEIKSKRAEIKVSIKTRLEANKQEKVVKVMEARLKRHDKAIEVVGKFITKVTERVNLFKSKGAVTAQAEGYLVQANVELESAKTKLAALKLKVGVTASSTTPKAELEKFRQELDAITTDTKEAHGFTIQAIVSLKGLSTASTTATTTSSN